MSNHLLFTPGPTMIPDPVMIAMNKPMIHHRSPEFEQILSRILIGLNQLVGNPKGQSIVMTASGSAAMEASVASLLHPKDHVVVVNSGKFGQRWVDLAKRYCLDADVIDVEWGKSVSLQEIEQRIKSDTKAVLTQACETSTGVFHPIHQMAKIIPSDCLLIVDAITALGVHDLHMERDGIDVMVGGSQKALMCPPGVATCSLSPKALERVFPSQSLYLSLQKELASQAKNVTAFTPAVSIMRGLAVALDLIFEEGTENVFLRHQMLQKRARSYIRAMNLPLFNSDSDASNGITVVGTGLSWDVKRWLQELKSKYQLWLAEGQDQLKDQVFRLAHMGFVDQEKLDLAFSFIVESLKDKTSIGSFEDIKQEVEKQ